RAGNTLVLLTTTRSPARSRSGSAAIAVWVIVPLARARCSRRAPPRSAGGSWAMSAAGRSKSKSRTSMSAIDVNPGSVDHRPSHGRLRIAPVLRENRPQRLVEAFPVAHERLSQDAFAHGTDLPERAVAAAVQHRRARLEPVAPDRVEREL